MFNLAILNELAIDFKNIIQFIILTNIKGLKRLKHIPSILSPISFVNIQNQLWFIVVWKSCQTIYPNFLTLANQVTFLRNGRQKGSLRPTKAEGNLHSSCQFQRPQ